jgi:hypothetical protein
VIDPAGQACTLAGAGHLPPVLAMPDGTTRVPDLPAGQSLGLGTAIYGQARIKLPPGTILALYTDGLVETRTRSYDHGILALRSLLTRERGHLEVICDALIGSLAERYEDDVTVVLARIPVRLNQRSFLYGTGRGASSRTRQLVPRSVGDRDAQVVGEQRGERDELDAVDGGAAQRVVPGGDAEDGPAQVHVRARRLREVGTGQG